MEQSDIVKMLQSYGFKGVILLTFDPSTHTSNYKFSDCNESKLRQLGESTVTSNGKVAVYKLGEYGKLGYCPSKGLVRFIYKGKARENKTAYDAKGSKIPTTPDIEQAFYRAQADKGKQVAFVKKVWTWANQHYFSSRMGLPKLYVAETCPFAPSLSHAYGVYTFSRHQNVGSIFIHSRCFKATEQIIVGTIIHEMCHQATYELDKITAAQGAIESGHGPEWAKWMVHCKLAPNRYAYEDTAEYGDALERLQRDMRKKGTR